MVQAETTKPRILIVDDAAAIRSVLKALLSSEGYQVVGDLSSAKGVPEAIVKLEPDIVCLDYNLPDSQGLDLLKAIHASHPTVAIVLITGDTDTELEEAAAEAGASGFIRKPFSQDRIAGEIRQVVHTQRLLAAAYRSVVSFTKNQARARALIADDSTAMRMLLKAILAKIDVEIIAEAWDGRQAVELTAQKRPDIVCLDLDMPVLSGLEALVQIRAAHPDMKILMITGRGNRETILQAAKSGAQGYILKPFNPEKVMEAVAKLLG